MGRLLQFVVSGYLWKDLSKHRHGFVGHQFANRSIRVVFHLNDGDVLLGRHELRNSLPNSGFLEEPATDLTTVAWR